MMWVAVMLPRLLQSRPNPGGTIVAKDATAKNIRITPEAYRGLAMATALLGESKSAYASRAILEAVRRDLADRWPEAAAELGIGPRPGPGKK